MAESIVQCDHCGAHGRRSENAAAPDFWFYIESVDRSIGTRGVYVVWACSKECRKAMWKRGPGRGVMDDLSTARMRARKVKG